MIDTIKLYSSVIATGDLVFKFVRCNKKEPEQKNGELRNLMCFAHRGIWTWLKYSITGLLLSPDNYRNLCLKNVLV